MRWKSQKVVKREEKNRINTTRTVNRYPITVDITLTLFVCVRVCVKHTPPVGSCDHVTVWIPPPPTHSLLKGGWWSPTRAVIAGRTPPLSTFSRPRNIHVKSGKSGCLWNVYMVTWRNAWVFFKTTSVRTAHIRSERLTLRYYSEGYIKFWKKV